MEEKTYNFTDIGPYLMLYIIPGSFSILNINHFIFNKLFHKFCIKLSQVARLSCYVEDKNIKNKYKNCENLYSSLDYRITN